ncbi:stress response protein NST1 [Contarinia nasturtii]|uniref:stress response protein NST1 n=1 Tax=Contarinia nasturtii TaxID=265458 RepID=UPI0012D46020|nr:stress response protein NST1 [Contarinia nasturtii]
MNFLPNLEKLLLHKVYAGRKREKHIKMMMKWHIFVTIILIQLKTFHCNTIELSSYSKVAKNGQPNVQPQNNTDQQPQIHRAREGVINSDLWLPKTFNDTETDKSTGRSIDDNRPFPFPLKNVAYSSYNKPSNHRSNHEPRIIYASSPVQQVAQDRFVPHETTDHFLEKNNRNRVKFSSNIKESDREGPQGSTSQVDASLSNYKPPSLEQTYAFPPNSGAFYPPPSAKKPISVSSYLPPPAGPASYPIFPGPISAKPVSMLHTQVDNSGSVDSMTTPNDMSDMNEMPNKDDVNSSNSDGPSDDTKLIDKPPADFVPNKKPSYPSFPFLDHHPHDHDHGHEHIHDHPPQDYHDHEPYSPYDDSLKHLHGFEAFPEVIIDDPHHHDYFDDHHDFHHHDVLPPPPPPPPPTTQPPPPPEPEEPEEQPRVKKYSYFYLSRSLWYIPLYFTVWFTFYVTWLILQSIGRHKVDLPNHLTNRRSIRDLSHNESVEKVNLLTEFVMSQIEEFKEKYL